VSGEVLLDTGPLVSILDRRQRLHVRCREFFEACTLPIVTTEAVLTESTHLLSLVPNGPAACLEFVLEAGIVVAPSNSGSLRRCRTLLAKYGDVPMDFTDATLVVLAEELGTDLVFTLDRDFTVYRIRGRKPFRIAPG
jgi:predicted nucleic acid-binding protein